MTEEANLSVLEISNRSSLKTKRLELNWTLTVRAQRSLPFHRGLNAALLRASITEQIPLPVETGYEHGPPVLVAARLIARHHRRIVPLGSRIPQRFAETSSAEFLGTAEKFHRIIHAKRGQQEFHGSIMLVAQRQDIGPHGPILAVPGESENFAFLNRHCL